MDKTLIKSALREKINRLRIDLNKELITTQDPMRSNSAFLRWIQSANTSEKNTEDVVRKYAAWLLEQVSEIDNHVEALNELT